MERELAFLKRHAFLLAGIGLPLLLVLTLLVARAVPRYLVDAPRYEVVYAVHANHVDGSDQRVLELDVVEGRVVALWSKVDRPVPHMRQRVFRVDPAGGALDELSVPEPGPDALEVDGEAMQLELAGLEDVRLDPRVVAPDGYEFTSRWSGGGGLFGELFGSGSRGLRVRVAKDGRRIDVPQPTVDGYGSVRFLGWAVPTEEAE